ncbi:MAG: 6-phosphofructokinase [Phycisphaeraceae bacterium]|nr:6-phosphofructokinase [Phycisphaerales bacterium]MCB9859461.1 6-phosphofructokinase [Phycisphaeraceae bacterium]
MIRDLPKGNAVIGQSGGPTAVINQSLVGVVEGLQTGLCHQGIVDRILGMRHAVRGLTQDDLVDLTDVPGDRLERIAQSPSAALGSTRDKPDAVYCQRIAEACARHNITYFFYIGGNDSSDACRIVYEHAKAHGHDLRCFHVPKTVDNDLECNDHTPGFASAARFVATAFRADALDNAALPGIKINIVMGRHAGFLTAASALARQSDDDGPHLIYLPEVPFDEDRFVDDVQQMVTKHGRCQIAVSEGIQDASGVSIGAKLIGGEKDDHGNVQLSGSGALGDQLAELLKKRLPKIDGKPPRVRSDTFGYLQRCWPDASRVDQNEARDCGRFAAKLAADGYTNGSVAVVRTSRTGEPYASECTRVELTDVAAKTRHMPERFIEGHNNVSRAFIEYCRPLVGELPVVDRF